MDYSHLHTYAPPQCVPENTGYTYSLSSSYSSAALDFENLHKLDPVFDSPRMSRRSLRLVTTTSFPDDLHNDSIASNISYSGGVSERSLSRSFRQQHNTSRQSSSSRRSVTLKGVSNTTLQNSFSSHVSDASMLSTVLDESSIREQTEVDHLWGLDVDDPKAGETTFIQANGDVMSAETQTTLINGYTCNDCSVLSERSNSLTVISATRAPALSTYTTSNKVYTRDKSQKHKSRELPSYAHRTMVLAKSAVATMTALLMKVFHMVILKLGYEHKAHSNYCGSMNVADYQTEDGHLHINGESICDDCKGTKQRETHITTVHTQSSSWAKRVTGKLWHIFSYTGYYLMQAARSTGAAGWFVSRKVLSFLWLAIVSPGKAASGIFWWLGTGWYQLTTLFSLLNVFLLTRCLPKAFRLLFLLIPLLLLLGLWWWGFDALLAMLPALGGFKSYTTQTTEDPIPSLKPMSDIYVSDHDKKELGLKFDVRIKELEKNFGLITAHHNHHIEDYKKLRLLVVNVQEQMGQMSDQGHMSSVIASLLDERFAKMKTDLHEKSTDEHSIGKNHEARILHLEALLTKLSEAIEEDRKRAQTNASGGEIQHQSLLRKRIESLEKEFAAYRAEFIKEQTVKSSCDLPDCVLQKVDARVRESIQMMFESQTNLPESLLQWISANYVSNEDLGTRLQTLELQILKNITYQISITKKVPMPKVVEGAVTGSVSGITQQDAQVLVNNALRLYSQDRTGMVDFALESGGGSILGTRCSETYGTKTALLSLFGIPLWYLSQSPRVVIQPDMYPGNCWAFKGAQGYLVVRLSMAIYPTAFSLEHIPRSLSPTGNITSAPKDFAVYGLEDEYQEDGTLLVQSMYNDAGEALQTFQVTVENKNPFQIVELRILSNWGHADYTCLYRFRAHGTPVK
ncbi:PREDICTED: SUN domain-containing protein 1 [Nanorana parkeri]|uniref:SUN domain-containing protein 1 n=1 Tax=Nanorana parkeri TaxID=125878 RepID=UPI000854D1ED|nr:PREDICTED: SUN domain-containing protein 1 [Nanorana parkeri]